MFLIMCMLWEATYICSIVTKQMQPRCQSCAEFAQHFWSFQFFSFFWQFVAKSNVFFFKGIFPILSYPSTLPCCDPEPQTTAKLPPHNVVAQHFGWFCHFCSWARCAGAARRGKRGETAVECAKCPTRQIWGPNQVPCIGRCKAP